MTDKEKFDGFKKEKLAENEEKYGKEIREKYGEATVEASNKMFGNMTEEDFAKMQQIEKDLFQALKEVEELLKTGGTSLEKALESQAAQRVYEKHRAWLGFTWPDYSAEAHRGLAEMYVADERFAKYYNDRSESQVVTLLRDIIVKYAV